MGISWSDYEDLRKAMMDFEGFKVTQRGPEEVYVEYLMHQESNIHALSDMITEFKDTKQVNAMVGAVKARADIYDRMIKIGQEFGFVEKVPEKTEIIAGLVLRDLTEDDLRSHIAHAISGLDHLLKSYDDVGNIIDIDPGVIHFPDPVQQKALPSGDKVKGHASNLVHKGRRVVKEKVKV